MYWAARAASGSSTCFTVVLLALAMALVWGSANRVGEAAAQRQSTNLRAAYVQFEDCLRGLDLNLPGAATGLCTAPQIGGGA